MCVHTFRGKMQKLNIPINRWHKKCMILYQTEINNFAYMICFTSTIVSYTTDLQSTGANFWDTLYNKLVNSFILILEAIPPIYFVTLNTKWRGKDSKGNLVLLKCSAINHIDNNNKLKQRSLSTELAAMIQECHLFTKSILAVLVVGTSKYLEVVEPCKQHLALWCKVQAMYIFPTALSCTFKFFLKSKNLK